MRSVVRLGTAKLKVRLKTARPKVKLKGARPKVRIAGNWQDEFPRKGPQRP
jgi:hypothetical protein